MTDARKAELLSKLLDWLKRIEAKFDAAEPQYRGRFLQMLERSLMDAAISDCWRRDAAQGCQQAAMQPTTAPVGTPDFGLFKLVGGKTDCSLGDDWQKEEDRIAQKLLG